MFLYVFQSVTSSLWHKPSHEKEAQEAYNAEKPESTVGAKGIDEIVEKFGDGETAAPIERGGQRCCVTSYLTRKDFAHHQPRDWSITNGESDDVDDERC